MSRDIHSETNKRVYRKFIRTSDAKTRVNISNASKVTVYSIV